jgi:hypothetical protein
MLVLNVSQVMFLLIINTPDSVLSFNSSTEQGWISTQTPEFEGQPFETGTALPESIASSIRAAAKIFPLNGEMSVTYENGRRNDTLSKTESIVEFVEGLLDYKEGREVYYADTAVFIAA